MFKKWGLINPKTKQPPTAPRPDTNIGACPGDQLTEIIIPSDEEIIVVGDDDENDD